MQHVLIVVIKGGLTVLLRVWTCRLCSAVKRRVCTVHRFYKCIVDIHYIYARVCVCVRVCALDGEVMMPRRVVSLS